VAYLKRAMRQPTSEALYQWAPALASSAAPELRSQAARMWANRPHYEPAPPPAVTSVRPAEAWQAALAAIDVDATALVQAFLDAAAHPPAERPRVYAYRADVPGGRYKGCDHYIHDADAVHFLRFLAYFGDATACVVDILAPANDDALQLLMNAPSADDGGILSSANVYEAVLRPAPGARSNGPQAVTEAATIAGHFTVVIMEKTKILLCATSLLASKARLAAYQL